VSWSSPHAPEPVDLAANRQVRVWTADRTWRLHAVQFVSDSLIGIPFQQPTTCDTCRVAVPLAAVDSMQTGGGSEGRAIALIAVPIALIGALAIYVMNTDTTP